MQTTAAVAPTWWQTFVASMYGILAMLLRGLVKLIVFLLIIVIGWFISSLVAKAIVTVLRAIHFNELADRLGLGGFTRRMGTQTDASQLVADIAKWLIRVIVLVAAFAALGIPAFSVVLSQLLLWLPNLAVAIVVLIVGGLAANGLGELVRGATAEAGFKNPGGLQESRGVGKCCARGGVGVCDRHCGQSGGHCQHAGKHSVHGLRRRDGSGRRAGVRHRWAKTGQRAAGQLVSQRKAVRPAETSSHRRS